MHFGANLRGRRAAGFPHSVLNNFGVGLYVFQSTLGERCQCIIYTAKRQGGALDPRCGIAGPLRN